MLLLKKSDGNTSFVTCMYFDPFLRLQRMLTRAHFEWENCNTLNNALPKHRSKKINKKREVKFHEFLTPINFVLERLICFLHTREKPNYEMLNNSMYSLVRYLVSQISQYWNDHSTHAKCLILLMCWQTIPIYLPVRKGEAPSMRFLRS